MPDTQNNPEEIQKKLLAKQKREAKRYDRMLSGLDDLETWIGDLLRQGLASVEGQPYSFWTSMASRMVDSQVKGADGLIKQMALLPGASKDWPEIMLAKLAELHLLIRSFRRLDQLPEPLAADVKTFAGISIKKEEIKSRQGINDIWLVIGEVESMEEELRVRRTWLKGIKTGKYVLILDYAHGSRDFHDYYEFGAYLKGEIVFFSVEVPLRGIFKAPFERHPGGDQPSVFASFIPFLSTYAHAVAASPWLQHFPLGINKVIPVIEKGQLKLIDKEKKVIPCFNPGLTAWKLIAFSGASPVAVFGEWNGKELLPLAAWDKSRLINLKL